MKAIHPMRNFTVAFAAAAIHAPAPGTAAQPSQPDCLAGVPVPIIVSIGETAPRRALLRGGAAPALEILDAGTMQPLWSASSSPPASQLFDGLRAAFAGSLLPVDLDGDGVHDRLYAGDLAGRLWRFDLHDGQPATQWATGGVFADLSLGAMRGFVAPPDVSLPAGATGSAWFNIAIGTARIGPAAVANRFYVLRDRHPFESWTQDRYDRWRALREEDLVPLPRPGSVLSQPAPDGWFIETGASDMFSPALTISGRATLALADPASTPGAGCRIAAVVSSIDLHTGAAPSAATTDAGNPLRIRVSMQAGESFRLVRDGTRAVCMAGEIHVPACDVDLSPRISWWRREDAD